MYGWQSAQLSFSTAICEGWMTVSDQCSYPHPTWVCASFVNVLIYRAFHSCSSYENFHIELCKIKIIISNNCSLVLNPWLIS